jgi:hypothetical protein
MTLRFSIMSFKWSDLLINFVGFIICMGVSTIMLPLTVFENRHDAFQKGSSSLY